jgi:hypothetical protein
MPDTNSSPAIQPYPDTGISGYAGRYYSSPMGTGMSTGSVTRGQITVGMPIPITHSVSVNSIACECTLAVLANNVRMGIYRMGSDGYPSALVVDAGISTMVVTGLKVLSFSPVTLTPGWYFVAILVTGGLADPAMRMFLTDTAEATMRFGAPAASPFGFGTTEDQGFMAGSSTLPDPFVIQSLAYRGMFPAIAIGLI